MAENSSVTSSEDFFDCYEQNSEVEGGVMSDNLTEEEDDETSGEIFQHVATMASYQPEGSGQSLFESAERVILNCQGSLPADAEEEYLFLSAVKKIVLLKHDPPFRSRCNDLLSRAEPRLKQMFQAEVLKLNYIFSNFSCLRELVELMAGSGCNLSDCFSIYETSRRNYMKDKYTPKISLDDDSLDFSTTRWVETVEIMIRRLVSERHKFRGVFPETVLSSGRGQSCIKSILKGYQTDVLDYGVALMTALRRTKSPQNLVCIRRMYQAWNISVPLVSGDLYSENRPKLYLENRLLRKYINGFCFFWTLDVVAHFWEHPRARLFSLALQDTYCSLSESNIGIVDVDIHPSVRSIMRNALLISNSGSNEELSSLQTLLPEVDSDPGEVSGRVNQLREFMSSLESNLVEKSKEFKDPAMRCIFMMNNIRYIVQRAKSSILENLLGKSWVRSLSEQTGQYATGYFRACWPKVLSALQDVEGSPNNLSKFGKLILKQSFMSFNKGFEGIYRKQTAWKVPDVELKEDLKILITQNVVLAYRTFLGRYQRGIESSRDVRKCCKYSEDDLQKYLQHLFQGMARKLPNKKPKCAPPMPQWNCFNQGVAVN